MHKPRLLTTKIINETFPGGSYQLEGQLVPVLSIDLDGSQVIYFEHHIMLWKSTGLSIGLQPMKGAFKRVFAGMPIFLTAATGKGEIAFSRNGVGHIFPIHLHSGDQLDVREHQFLAATGNVIYDISKVKGYTNILTGASGFFMDHFSVREGEGIVWLHGNGNVFEKVLGDNEQIDIEPGAWLYKDPQVKLQTAIQRLSTSLFGGATFVCNRFTGPGRVGIQSMSIIVPEPRQK